MCRDEAGKGTAPQLPHSISLSLHHALCCIRCLGFKHLHTSELRVTAAARGGHHQSLTFTSGRICILLML